jgi:hypothetical protein
MTSTIANAMEVILADPDTVLRLIRIVEIDPTPEEGGERIFSAYRLDELVG